MSKKLIHLVSLVFVLDLILISAGNAAEADLVGWWKFEIWSAGGSLMRHPEPSHMMQAAMGTTAPSKVIQYGWLEK